MSVWRATLILKDASGTGDMSFQWYQSDTTNNIAQAVINAGTAQLGALFLSFQPTQPTSTGTGANPITSAANVQYATALGNRVAITIPSALTAIYLGDGETVNPSAGAITALSTAILSHGCDAAGNAVTAYTSGHAVGLRRPGIYH